MTSFLSLTPNMAQAQTVTVPNGGKVAMDIVIKPSEKQQKLSFTTVPETPPGSPPNELQTSEANQTVIQPTEDNVVLDTNMNSGTQTQASSTAVPETPPRSPPNDDQAPEEKSICGTTTNR